MRILILSLFFYPIFLFTQTSPHPPCKHQNFPFLPLSSAFQSLPGESVDSIGTFQIKLYYFNNSINYNDPGAPGSFLDALEQTNRYFEGTGMQFALCGSPVYVDTVAYFPSGTFIDWFREHADPKYIHVFDVFVPFAGGTASFPGQLQWITMYPINAQTLAHELGHHFGLYHTFNTFGTPRTLELVNGANCDTTGDLICDTPADPYPQASFDSCRYTGMATDANGDPYQPDVFNLMSYYQAANLGCGPEHFSPGQGARMQGIWRQDLFYLHRADSSPGFTGLPSSICVGDSSPHVLMGFPAGGTFSGPGIRGNTLYTDSLSVGGYEITYHPPAQGPVQAYQKFDALNPVYGASKDTNSWWQGFLASENAPVEAIHIRAIADSNIQISWAIYEGIGSQGTLLYQQTDTLQAFQDMRWHRFTLRDSSFSQLKDSLYSLAVWTQGAPLRFSRCVRQFTYQQLAGSMANEINGPFRDDFIPNYAIEISSTQAICQGPVTYTFAVVDIIPFEFELEDRFCIADSNQVLDSLLSRYTTLYYPDRKYQVNQTPDSILRIEQLGTGQHLVEMTYKDYNGCSAEKTFPINITGIPEVNIPTAFCENDAAFPLTGLWPGGTYALNGQSVDSINPSRLPAGRYQLDMWLPQVYDTASYIDQALQRADSGLKSYFVQPDSLYFQSFRPESDDFFHELSCRIALRDSMQAVAFLYQGTPAQGNLIWSDTSWLKPAPNLQYPRLLKRNDFLLQAEKDSLYTLAFRQISGQSTAIILGGIKDPYPRGHANVVDTFHPHIDWLFQVYLHAEKNCGSSQNHPIEIFALPQAPPTFLQGPDSVIAGETAAYYWPQAWADSIRLSIIGGICMNCPPPGDSIYIRWDSVGSQSVWVQSWNTQGCEGDSINRFIQVFPTSAMSIGALQRDFFQLFPNPTRDYFYLKSLPLQAGILKLEITDIHGRILQSHVQRQLQGQAFDFKLDASSWAKGSYILRIDVDGKRWHKILVKM